MKSIETELSIRKQYKIKIEIQETEGHFMQYEKAIVISIMNSNTSQKSREKKTKIDDCCELSMLLHLMSSSL